MNCIIKIEEVGIEHRFCLRLRGEKFWIRSNYGYACFKQESNERYRLVDMYGKHTFLIYRGKWTIEKGDTIGREIEFDKYCKTLIYLENWTGYRKLLYLGLIKNLSLTKSYKLI